MKKSKKELVLLLIIMGIVMASCAGIREKRAEKSQPFSPHKNHKPQHH